ncbi:hypothetical protein CK510_27630 [Brunnivagina elsteri CCALA 953]|uniref:ASCH domain-containing protein n=1 Tax=Brunnivagina elsteri CCALA 953 TaxID=987040 RepID=A0A2A2TB92_9CYAN|nr:hypothetical protein CK510_27630 [Calothrix elsteri CCALA 953]
MNTKEVEKYWQAYLAVFPNASGEKYEASQFGDSSTLADKLGNLIVKGIKTATCSALWEWKAEAIEPPKELGLKTIVLDGENNPLCIIETTEVTIRPFCEVDTQFSKLP